jgi:predicted ester cyclase
MNKLLLFLATVISLCFFSCTDTSSTTSSSSSDSQSEKNRANSREVYTAMETGDVSKVDSFIDKDIVDHEGNIHGLDSLKKMFANMHNSVKDLKMESIANATDGDYNFAYVRMTGTTTDASMGMAAGTKLDMMFVDVVKIKDGKAVEHWGYSDRNDMMKMMKMGK